MAFYKKHNSEMAIVAGLLSVMGGNSEVARRARANVQRRDRRGRFAEMGGGFSFVIKGLDGAFQGISGKVVGSSGETDVEIEVSGKEGGLPAGIYVVNSTKGTAVRAILSDEAFEDAPEVDLDNASNTHEGSFIDVNEVTLLDAPSGWSRHKPDDPFQTQTLYKSDDGYYAEEFYSAGNAPDNYTPRFKIFRSDLYGQYDDAMGDSDLVGTAFSWDEVQRSLLDDSEDYQEEIKIAKDFTDNPKKYISEVKPVESRSEKKSVAQKVDIAEAANKAVTQEDIDNLQESFTALLGLIGDDPTEEELDYSSKAIAKSFDNVQLKDKKGKKISVTVTSASTVVGDSAIVSGDDQVVAITSVDVDFIDEKTGEVIGGATRDFAVRRDNTIYAINQRMVFDDEHQGRGVGSAWNARNAVLYSHTGIEKITTTGVSSRGKRPGEQNFIGGTHWARSGFDWATDGDRQAMILGVRDAVTSWRKGKKTDMHGNSYFDSDSQMEDVSDLVSKAMDESFDDQSRVTAGELVRWPGADSWFADNAYANDEYYTSTAMNYKRTVTPAKNSTFKLEKPYSLRLTPKPVPKKAKKRIYQGDINLTTNADNKPSELMDEFMEVANLNLQSDNQFSTAAAEQLRVFGREDLTSVQKILQGELDAWQGAYDEWLETGTWEGEKYGVQRSRKNNSNLTMSQILPETLAGYGSPETLKEILTSNSTYIKRQLNHVNARLAKLDELENGGSFSHMDVMTLQDLPNFKELTTRGQEIRDFAHDFANASSDDPDYVWLLHTGPRTLDNGVLDPNSTLGPGGGSVGGHNRAGMDTKRLNGVTRSSVQREYLRRYREAAAAEHVLKVFKETGVWEGQAWAENIGQQGATSPEFVDRVRGVDDENVNWDNVIATTEKTIASARQQASKLKYFYDKTEQDQDNLSYFAAGKDGSDLPGSPGYARLDSETSKTYLVRVPRSQALSGYGGPDEWQVFDAAEPIASFEFINQRGITFDTQLAALALLEQVAIKHIEKEKPIEEPIEEPIEDLPEQTLGPRKQVFTDTLETPLKNDTERFSAQTELMVPLMSQLDHIEAQNRINQQGGLSLDVTFSGGAAETVKRFSVKDFKNALQTYLSVDEEQRIDNVQGTLVSGHVANAVWLLLNGQFEESSALLQSVIADYDAALLKSAEGGMMFRTELDRDNLVKLFNGLKNDGKIDEELVDQSDDTSEFAKYYSEFKEHIYAGYSPEWFDGNAADLFKEVYGSSIETLLLKLEKISRADADAMGVSPFYDSAPLELDQSDFESVPSIRKAISSLATTSKPKQDSLMDGGDIEDGVVTFGKVAKASTPEEKKLIAHFKLTSWAGRRLQQLFSDEDDEVFPIVFGNWTKFDGAGFIKRTLGENGVMIHPDVPDHSDRELQTDRGATYEYKDPDGRFNVTFKTARMAENVLNNSVEITFSSLDPSDQDIKDAFKVAGVKDPRPARKEDVRIIAENRLISVLGNSMLPAHKVDRLVDPQQNISKIERERFLENIKSHWGVTADDVTMSVAANGSVEMKLPHFMGRDIARETGVEAFHHSFSITSEWRSGDPATKITDDVVDSVLKILLGSEDGSAISGLMSTNERFSSGTQVAGMSSARDITTGGGDYVYFTPGTYETLNTSAAVERGETAVIAEIDAPELLRRMDFWANHSDQFGSRANIDPVESLTPDSYEYMVKNHVPAGVITRMYVHPKVRAELIARLKKFNITTMFGIPIDEFFYSTTPTSDWRVYMGEGGKGAI